MTPAELAEIFNVGARTARKYSELQQVLDAMANHCRKIDERGRVKEHMFMGKPIKDLTYEEAVFCRDNLSHSNQWVPAEVWHMLSKIINQGSDA